MFQKICIQIFEWIFVQFIHKLFLPYLQFGCQKACERPVKYACKCYQAYAQILKMTTDDKTDHCL